jgi:hypothetical protein
MVGPLILKIFLGKIKGFMYKLLIIFLGKIKGFMYKLLIIFLGKIKGFMYELLITFVNFHKKINITSLEECYSACLA